MMAPARTPDLGAFMDNIEALRAAMGGSLASRMARRGDEQVARWDAGERSPTPLTEENIWLADDVAGALLGPIGMAGVIKAYHGSPHRFDRFDMSKIGTGEGAQAYGHGLYFAESPDVAAGYQERLAMVDDGPPAFFRDAVGNAIDEAPGSVWLLRGDDTSTSFEEMQKRAADKLQWAQGLKNKQLSGIETRKAQEAIDWLRDNPGANFAPNEVRGAFYTTRLDVEPEDLLDYDAPLPQSVRDIISARLRERDLGDEGVKAFWRTAGDTGDAYVKAERFLGPGSLIDAMKEAGYKGISYLDQGSRASGEGTRNFVIFDDKLVDITHVDGKPVTPAERAEVLAQHQRGAPETRFERVGKTSIKVYVGNDYAGEMNLSERAPFISSITVEPQFRRQGIGRELYRQADELTGGKLIPSPLGLTDDAVKIWRKRLASMQPEQAQAVLDQAMEVGRGYGISESHLRERFAPLLAQHQDGLPMDQASPKKRKKPDA